MNKSAVCGWGYPFCQQPPAGKYLPLRPVKIFLTYAQIAAGDGERAVIEYFHDDGYRHLFLPDMVTEGKVFSGIAAICRYPRSFNI
jgi:hypothetical protein